MRFYYINKKQHGPIELENTLEALQGTLGFNDPLASPTILIGGHKYILLCNDNGKIKHLPISAMTKDNLTKPSATMQEPFIVGDILITKFDGIEDFTDLNDSDIKLLNSRFIEANYFGIESYKEVLLLD